MAILEDIIAEGNRLLDHAEAETVGLRLLGGAAVRARAREITPAYERAYNDLDFVVVKGTGPAADRLFRAAGYAPDREFNALNGRRRMRFLDDAHARHIDLFVGEFRLCHAIPMTGRIDLEPRTLPLAELLLTKLQIVELNEKDLRDVLLLLRDHSVADHDGEAVNGDRIAQVCATDWGLWRTFTANLGTCHDHVGDYETDASRAKMIDDRLAALLERVNAVPKSRGWRLRARVGERKRWYELPEEVDEDATA